jgi:hypothetical protein
MLIGAAGAPSRQDRFDAALVQLVSDAEEVHSCLVETSSGAFDAVGRILPGWFVESGDLVVTPLFRADGTSLTPDERMATRWSKWVPFGAFGALTVVMSASWIVRRRDFALYGQLGASRGAVLTMGTVEAVAMVVSPVLAGEALGLVAFAPESGAAECAAVLAAGQLVLLCFAIFWVFPVVVGRRQILLHLRGG